MKTSRVTAPREPLCVCTCTRVLLVRALRSHVPAVGLPGAGRSRPVSPAPTRRLAGMALGTASLPPGRTPVPRTGGLRACRLQQDSGEAG